jgi:hypothetical protein
MKIEKEEIDLIMDQRNKIDTIVGQIANIELQKSQLINSYSNLIEESNNTRKELEEKYGSISIDLSDGSYTKLNNENK